MNVHKPFLSVVIPVYNEADILEQCIAEIKHYIGMTNLQHEIIVINDGSTDRTWEVLCKMALGAQEIKGVTLSRNFGKEAAISAGLKYAQGDIVILMDGDLQHPPSLIPEMIKVWREEKADIVEALKQERGTESFYSRIGARLFYLLMKALTNLPLDKSTDFKLLNRPVVDAYNRLPESSRFFRGMVSWLGFRRIQLPFSVPERMAGKSKWSVLTLFKLAIIASTSYSSLPLHIVTILGVITFSLSILLSIQTLYMKISGAAVSGFATVILLLLFIGSTLMISLGIIGIYISRIFEEVKNRPQYIETDLINLTGINQ
jgi:dolichol-phosphate mannosyltransferase